MMMDNGIQQLALISSVLGGFSFTFIGALLGAKKGRKITYWLFLTLMVASISFLISSLGWSLIHFEAEQTGLIEHHQFLVKCLVIGLIFIIISLGLSGFMHGKATGITTSIISFMGLILLFSQVLSRYIVV